MSDKDKDREGENGEDLSKIFRDLGKDFSRLIEKLAQQGEQGVHLFDNLDQFEDIARDTQFDLDDIQEFMKKFSFEGNPFDNFDPGPVKNDKSSTSEKKRRGEVRTPNVDIFDENDSIEVFVELPGVDEQNISLEIDNGKINLRARGTPNIFQKEIDLPCSEAHILNQRFNNGILHLTLGRGSAK